MTGGIFSKEKLPKNPGSLDKKKEAPISGKSPKAVSGIAKSCIKV